MRAGAWVALSPENPKSQSQVCVGAVVPVDPISLRSEMTGLISRCPKTGPHSLLEALGWGDLVLSSESPQAHIPLLISHLHS